MTGWKIEAIQLSVEENKNAREIYNTLKSKYNELNELNDVDGYNRVRYFIKKYRRQHNIRRDCTGKEISSNAPVKQPSKYTFQNGSHTYEDIVEITDGRPITPEIIMQAHNLDPSCWDVVSFTSNTWQSQGKDENVLNLCQSKLTVKLKKQKEITLEEIDTFFDKKRFTALFNEKTYDKTVLEGDNVLEIAYTDPHNGLLAWRHETGEDYDLNIARKRFIDCAYDIVTRCKNKKIKRIELVMLGDVLHTANDNQSTEKGTLQSCDGRYAKMNDYTERTIVEVISILREIAPVNVTWVSGNHSRSGEYMLMKCVSKSFSDVSFDISPNPIKQIKIGNALIGLAHGDMPKKNLTGNVDMVAREIGGIKYIEQHCGHFHSEETITVNGIKVRFLPTMCSSSFWEHQQGYLNQKAMISFVWSEDKGIREYWINNI